MSRRPRRPRSDEEAALRAREVTRRAVRRLDVLEWVILSGAVALALGLGFLVAWLLEGIAGWPLRPTWIVASLVLFVVPGVLALLRIRKDEREDRSAQSTRDQGD